MHCLATLVQVEVHGHTHVRHAISLTCGEIGSHMEYVDLNTTIDTTNIESISTMYVSGKHC